MEEQKIPLSTPIMNAPRMTQSTGILGMSIIDQTETVCHVDQNHNVRDFIVAIFFVLILLVLVASALPELIPIIGLTISACIISAHRR